MRGQKIRGLLPKQGIQSLVTLEDIRRIQEQPGYDGVRCCSIQEIVWSGVIGFACYSLECRVRKI
ncbi:hypothetical protein GCM10007857_07730 [Bradyrhizobium iriomotense]|uniref:Transposase n=1 Tax=Bradyrhizobium iriomotense TaxID=441950 RepID=A0ABQ6AR68_9BRAD|nr:hypothetical protein GCM10007857_07730 [Bradyrhizobium iriomotense]